MKPLSLLVFLPILLFSFELEFNKKFNHQLPHDILKTSLIITITDDSEKEVDNRLNKFNDLIKNYNKVDKKLGIFNIRPKFRHSNNTPTIIGYIGELIYKIESDKALYMDDFISKVTDLKKFRDTTVSISSLSWTVQETTYNVALDLLRLEAINWAKTYAHNLSNDLKENCKIKSISIDTSNTSANSDLYKDIDVKSTSITIPKANQQIVQINPKFKLECK
ncbi:MAG: SIMPL domain-containing protein [Halarcobacter sp.]